MVVGRPAKRTAGDFELWRPEQIHPGHLEARAIEVDQASGCASSGRTASRSFCAHAVIARRLRYPRKTGQRLGRAHGRRADPAKRDLRTASRFKFAAVAIMLPRQIEQRGSVIHQFPVVVADPDLLRPGIPP